MANYTVTLTPEQDDGVYCARYVHNKDLTIIPPGTTIEENPDYIATEADYVQFVMASAADGWRKSYIDYVTPGEPIPGPYPSGDAGASSTKKKSRT